MSKTGKYRHLSSRKERVNLPFPHVFTHFQPPLAWGSTHPHWGGPSSLLGLLNPKACLFQKHLYRHVHAQSFNSVQLFANPRTVAHQAPLSKEFSRQEYWSGLLFPHPRDLPESGIEPTSPSSCTWAGGFFTTELPGKPSHPFLGWKGLSRGGEGKKAIGSSVPCVHSLLTDGSAKFIQPSCPLQPLS